MTKALLIDCMEYMRGLEDNAFDLAIADAEYGIGESMKDHSSRNTPVKQKNGSVLTVNQTKYTRKEWDSRPVSKEVVEEIIRVSKHQIFWGANHFSDLLPPSSGWIVWDKVNSGDFSDCELAWTSFKKGVRQIEFMWNGMMQARSLNQGKVMQGNKKLNEKRIHPTQKPVKLYEWTLDNYAQAGWRIFDSHLGSGSSRIAAYNKGFEFVGCEIDKEYFELQEKRFWNHSRQYRMFQ